MSFSQFYKDVDTISEIVQFVKKISENSQKIEIWDAGCGMGQSTCTMAIMIAEAIGLESYKNKISILATDIDELRTFKNGVENALYPKNDLVLMPKNLIIKYFIERDEKYQIIPYIRDNLQFRRHDLLSLKPPRKEFDLITCLNVLHHFRPSEQSKVVEMFGSSLKNHGKLFRK